MGFDAISLAQGAGEVLDLAGVFIIILGLVASTIYAILELIEKKRYGDIYRTFRKNVGRCLLLGLEFLVAGDIIRSVTGEPSFTNVVILVVIVLVRSFLSITFEMEVEGRWPWQKATK